jgi:hypothetical protein
VLIMQEHARILLDRAEAETRRARLSAQERRQKAIEDGTPEPDKELMIPDAEFDRIVGLREKAVFAAQAMAPYKASRMATLKISGDRSNPLLVQDVSSDEIARQLMNLMQETGIVPSRFGGLLEKPGVPVIDGELADGGISEIPEEKPLKAGVDGG